jgi:hypothetical protein
VCEHRPQCTSISRRKHVESNYTKNMSEPDFPLPPPTFEFLVFSLKTQAELRLGLLAYGEKPDAPDLPAARHAIDLLGMISDKTRGNLSLDEQRLIENALTELRFRFVQVGDAVAKSAAAGAPGSSGPSGDALAEAAAGADEAASEDPKPAE